MKEREYRFLSIPFSISALYGTNCNTLYEIFLRERVNDQNRKNSHHGQYSVVKKGATASKFAGSLQWIEDAGIIARCYNLAITELPLDGNAEKDTFKVYMRDMGLFVAMLEDGTQFDILQGNLFGYKGAIFEGLIADIFTKMGRKLYYFRKDSGLEVDFVIRYKGECTLVEVKAVSGNTKSAKTKLDFCGLPAAKPYCRQPFDAVNLGCKLTIQHRILSVFLYIFKGRKCVKKDMTEDLLSQNS